MKEEYILDRLEKAIYMGFLLDKKSNDCLGNKYYLNPKMVMSYIIRNYTDKGIDVYDLDLLVKLKRSGVTTMGDTYLAFNNKKYIIHFSYLYNIV